VNGEFGQANRIPEPRKKNEIFSPTALRKALKNLHIEATCESRVESESAQPQIK
jgi:hypothetical protein